MHVVIVGAGSAGLGFGRLLEADGAGVCFVSRRDLATAARYATIGAALEAQSPDLVVIANETSLHAASIAELARLAYAGDVLVEKPIAASTAETFDASGFRRCLVAYQLRFHPAVKRLRQALAGEKLISAHVEAGHNLAGWRPGRDYKSTYSSCAQLGGGVLRDLSHELDLIHLLFGTTRRISALGGNFGVLGIEADETWSILAETELCPAITVCLNYLARCKRRHIFVETRDHSFEVDLLKNTFSVDGETTLLASSSASCRAEMLREFLSGSDETLLCSVDEGRAVVRVIEAIEQAARTRCWVDLTW